MIGLKHVGWGLGYAVLAAFGGCGLWVTTESAERLAAALLVMIGVGGLLMVVFVPWFDRRRPGPVLTVAPTGAPATYFRRSAFMVGCSLVFTIGLAGWTAAVAVLLFQRDHLVAAVLVGAFAAGLLWPAALAARGMVSPGGLWLTPFGLEHRHGAVSWAISWADLASSWAPPTRTVLPFAPGRGVVPIQPVRLELLAGRYPVKHRTARWVWTREIREAGPDALVVDAYDLAGGPALIAGTIRHYLDYPRLRAHLGTDHSLPRRNCSCRPDPQSALALSPP